MLRFTLAPQNFCPVGRTVYSARRKWGSFPADCRHVTWLKFHDCTTNQKKHFCFVAQHLVAMINFSSFNLIGSHNFLAGSSHLNQPHKQALFCHDTSTSNLWIPETSFLASCDGMNQVFINGSIKYILGKQAWLFEPA